MVNVDLRYNLYSVAAKNVAISLILVSLVLFCGILRCQEHKQSTQPEKHEVEVRLVLLDVIVTKDGEFVKDLSSEDFEIYEDVKYPLFK